MKKEIELGQVELGATGEKVSQMSLGCMLMGTTMNREASFDMLDCYAGAGGNFVDTANCYSWWFGNGEFVGDESEAMLGEWMKRRGNRDDVFLATKVGGRLQNPQGVRDADGSIDWSKFPEAFERQDRATIRSQVDGSLKRLQTDRIDLYYIHVTDERVPLEETLGALDEIVREGKVRHIACSNFRTWRIERARQISEANGWAKFVAIQQKYSYLWPKPRTDLAGPNNVGTDLLDYVSKTPDLALLAYSPLLGGAYDDPSKRDPNSHWPKYETEENRKRLAVLEEMAGELNVTNSQLVFAWLLHHSPSVIPVVGASSAEQFSSNLVGASIDLSADQVKSLDDAGD